MSDSVRRIYSRLLIITWVMVSSLPGLSCSVSTGQAMKEPLAIQTGETGRPPNSPDLSRTRLPWSAVQNWVDWLDNPNLEQLEASQADLLVIDYSANGSAIRAFNAVQLRRLRATRAQRRIVAYLSIGEAEAYRGYWQKDWRPGQPAWLGAEDADWQGNYWVNYWEPAWQRIIYRYLDAIIDAGFDGVYLDRVDAYEEDYAAGHENDMVQFVKAIARYARIHSPLGEDFGIIVQNAEELAGAHPDYVRLVTGIGREEVYTRAMDHQTSATEQARVERWLDLFLYNSRGKLVLTVDYATQLDLICRTYRLARARGYVPYVTQATLDHLSLKPLCS